MRPFAWLPLSRTRQVVRDEERHGATGDGDDESEKAHKILLKLKLLELECVRLSGHLLERLVCALLLWAVDLLEGVGEESAHRRA